MSKTRVKYVKISIIIAISLLFVFIYYDNREERVFFDENYIQMGGSQYTDRSCHLPLNVNPFDESVAKYIKVLPKSIECKYETDPKNGLTFVDSAGTLRQSVGHYKCKYQWFDRLVGNDNQIVYKSLRVLDPRNGIPMGDNSFVWTECEDMAGRKVYENTHFWFPLTANPNASASSDSTDRPSVLILVIESLSRVNYLRFMPQTRDTIEKLGKVVYMKGLTKLADNSFPNMVPFLTGRRVWHNELRDEDFGPYDDWPFVWKDFSRAGYKTALIEDFPTFTLFNYESKGFREKPVDWYPRPYWIHLFRDVSKILLGLIPFELSNCYIDRYPKVDLFLQQIKHFITECNAKHFPYFAFSFYIEVTHNDFNRAQLIDSHVSQFFHQMRHQLNNTILVLMGDHGNRFGPVLQTVIGRIEERMPLFGVRIPDQLSQRYPHLLATLESNSERLMTWLDLHHLLADIASRTSFLL
ncbi:unnamed protein product [Oppiella nova]|uniref:Uncharacterized protein n=1 Tax=Oppiella nova TaxID=334625 RepID=A0A7R9MC44_9ACAR|nr:unnamed protein product [Oppiella nova]CAG2174591.1 unnamed protein product [Oppiella nova]